MAGGVERTDAVIVGAGPVGLFAVFALGMVRLKCHVVDSLEALGGQVAALYPTKPIYDIPGFAVLDGNELIDRLAAQAAPFAPVYHFGRAAERLSREPDGAWRLDLAGGGAVTAPVVVLAAGVGAFGPTRPPLEGLAEYEGRSVFYLVRRIEEFAGKRLVIAGGGDSAVDWAIALAPVAASIQVVHRRDRFRCAPESEARLRALAAAGRIELVIPYQLHGLRGETGRLSQVVVADLDGNIRALAADILLPFFGLAGDLGPLAGWGLAIEGRNLVVDPATCATNLPGVFAIGDIAAYPGKLKLILQGFSEAAMMAQAAHRVARPGQELHREHSTTTGLPKF